MKKSILIVLLIACLAVAVGISGCLNNNDDNVTNGTNNTTNGTNNTTNGTNNTTNGSNNTTNGTNNTTNQTPGASFNGSVVTLSPVPSGYELLAVRNVTANAENLGGLTDALNGYLGTYAGANSSNVYLYAFQTANNSSAQGYVRAMIDYEVAQHPQTNNITTVQVNGHDVARITETLTTGGTTVERSTLVWASGDRLIILNGPATYDQIRTIAEASGL